MIYLYLFLEFFKVGLFTFGGAYAMIPLIKEIVLKHEWLTEEAFYDFIGVCESTPGPIAVNMATYVGNSQAGILGSIVATLGVILPSFIIILLIASVLKKLTKNKYFIYILDGIKPVIVSLILSTGLILLAKQIGYVDIKTFAFNYRSLIVIAILVFIYFGYKLYKKKSLNPILLIIISAALGIIVSII